MRRQPPARLHNNRIVCVLIVCTTLVALTSCQSSPTPTAVSTFTASPPPPTASPTPRATPNQLPTPSGVTPTAVPPETGPQPFTWQITSDPASGFSFFPTGLAQDGDGNIYVVDTLNHRIQKYSSDGELITQWGSEGSGDGQFQFQYREPPNMPLGGLAVDPQGNVYVADYGNHRVQKFDSQGVLLSQWGTQGSEDGQFDGPSFIAVDGESNVYVTDEGNGRVQKFDKEGRFLAQLGPLSVSEDESELPTGLAVDAYDNLYVIVRGPPRILKFNKHGQFLKKLGGAVSVGPLPMGVTLNGEGCIFVADHQSGTIRVLDDAGKLLKELGSDDATQRLFVGPWDLVVDAQGNLYVSDPLQGALTKLPPSAYVER